MDDAYGRSSRSERELLRARFIAEIREQLPTDWRTDLCAAGSSAAAGIR